MHFKMIFFISNRQVNSAATQSARENRNILSYEDLFTNVPDVAVTFGYAIISYPVNRQKGDASHGLNSTSQNPLYDFSVVDHGIANSPEAFRALISTRYPSDDDKALIYIHGLDNTFSDAAGRMAQLAIDLEITGVPVFLSWPSDAGRLDRYLPFTSILPKDYHNVHSISTESQKYAVIAMDEVANGGKRSFEIIAHSMGADIATNALITRETNINLDKQTSPHSIVLAAPDISTNLFDATLRPAIVRSWRHIVVYCSRDRALLISRFYNDSDERLGYCATQKDQMVGIEIVSIIGFIRDFARHAYYLSSVKILEDIRRIISPQAPDGVPQNFHNRHIELP
jgi:esterase/lipase superfamily enzyme